MLIVGIIGDGGYLVRWRGMTCMSLIGGWWRIVRVGADVVVDGWCQVGWCVYECVRTALEDIVHDVGQWFSLVCWFGLLVRVRRIGVAVVAIVDVGGHVVVIGG